MDYKQLILELQEPKLLDTGDHRPPTALELRAARALNALLSLNNSNFDLLMQQQNKLLKLKELAESLSTRNFYKVSLAEIEDARSAYLDARNKEYD